jgi:hypothetical protein
MDIDTSLTIVNTYNLFLSSANRSEGIPQNFSVSLIKPITLTNPNNWLTVRVGSAEIPYVFKLINSLNNIISYQLVRNSVTYNDTITIETGNYNILTLIAEFKTKLVTSIQTLSSWDASSILSFTYNRNTGKVTFSMVGTDSIATTLTILSASNVMYRCLGVTTGFSFGYTDPSTRTDSISTQNVNVSQNTALYIRSESLTQTSNQENIVGLPEYSDILAKIQIGVQPQSIILWTNSTDLEIDITNKILDRINIYLGDSSLYEVDMGNLDWTLRLTINEWSYKSDSHHADRAINLRSSQEDTTELIKEREKIVKRLNKLKTRLVDGAQNQENESQG